MCFTVFVLGFLPWVAQFAHIFGFLGGLLLSFAIMPYVRWEAESERRQGICKGACLLVYLLILATGISIFYLLPDFDCQVNSDSEMDTVYTAFGKASEKLIVKCDMYICAFLILLLLLLLLGRRCGFIKFF